MSTTATRRRAKAKAQAARKPTPLQREAAEQREGIRAGAVLREREAAFNIVTTAAALDAEGVALSAAAEAERSGAVALLADAEAGAAKRGRNVGRWIPRDDAAMSGADVLALASAAAGAAARQMRGAGMPRLTDDEWTDLRNDLALTLLERAGGNAPRWRAIDPTLSSEARAAAAAWMRAPYLDADTGGAMSAAYRECVARMGDYRGAWRSYLTASARTYARGRIDAHRVALAAEEAARDPRSDRLTTLSAEGAQVAAELGARHTLSTAERAGVEAALSGLTHRERAALNGSTVEAAKQAAKNGRAALRKRFPDAASLRDAAADAERAARGNDPGLYVNGSYSVVATYDHAHGAPAEARGLQALRTLTACMEAAPDRAERPRLPRRGRRLLLTVPTVRRAA